MTQPPHARAPQAPQQPATPASCGQSVSRAVTLSLESIDDLFTPAHTISTLTPAAQQCIQQRPTTVSHQPVVPSLHLGPQSQQPWAAVIVQAEAITEAMEHVEETASAVGGEVERYAFGRWVGDDPPWAAIKEMVNLIKHTMGDMVDQKVLKHRRRGKSRPAIRASLLCASRTSLSRSLRIARKSTKTMSPWLWLTCTSCTSLRRIRVERHRSAKLLLMRSKRQQPWASLAF